MSRLVNKCLPDLVIIGNAGDKRVELFQQSLIQLDLPPARLLTYLDLLAGRVSLAERLTPASLVRIESPGRNFEVERALLALGSECAEPEGDGRYLRLSRREVEQLTFDKGLILPSRQWYLGYSKVLDLIARHLRPEHLFNLPADIRLMFDKPACHALLQEQGIAVPPGLGTIRSYEELQTTMRAQGCSQVFVKLAHGSSASGVVAYRYSGARHKAITTVQMVESPTGLRLYNSRKLQVYEHLPTISRLIDALCAHRVQVERWLPKAGYAQQTFDVRVLTIAGLACHSIARLSRSPLTNLHLLNARENIERIVEQIGEATWTRAIADCERAARLFGSLYMGIDLLFTPDKRHHAILELNAFGDFLPGLVYHGQDTHTAEITALLQRVEQKTGSNLV